MGTTATCIACGLASFNSLKVSSIGNVGVAWNERVVLVTLHNLLLHHTVTSNFLGLLPECGKDQ